MGTPALPVPAAVPGTNGPRENHRCEPPHCACSARLAWQGYWSTGLTALHNEPIPAGCRMTGTANSQF